MNFIELLESWGYIGLFIAAFIAGSVFPFSSEAVMAALQVAGLNPMYLFLAGTLGNTLGSLFNYWIGTFGRLEWIERYLHLKAEKVHEAQAWMQHYGAWIGVLCFLPIIGSIIAVTLGYMRANPWLSALAILIGKSLRYLLVIYAVSFF
ncbi:MAG: DedA family protein [Bacteroidaceae bacterium]|nr:DedA family protein [Bacteroidaceae bacterium]